MGKATIISGGEEGKYEVDVVYNLDRVNESIIKLKDQKDKIQAEIEKLLLTEDHTKIPLLKLEIAALQKKINTLEAIPKTKRVTAWAADLIEDLTGDVGTAEVPDDPAGNVNIVPDGVDGGMAAYIPARDGAVRPIMGMGPAGAWFNRAIMPAVQKYRPMYRYGKITAVNGDKCDVDLIAAEDMNQRSINQADSLSDVDIQYMTCNGAAFEVDDEVLICFNRGDVAPRVVGFKSNPKPCDGQVLYLVVDGTACVWDPYEEAYATDIPDGNDGFLEFPCDVSKMGHWLSLVDRAEKPGVRLWSIVQDKLEPTMPGDTEWFQYPVSYNYTHPGCGGAAVDISTRTFTFEYINIPVETPNGSGYNRRFVTHETQHQSWAAGACQYALLDALTDTDNREGASWMYEHYWQKGDYWEEGNHAHVPKGYCREALVPGFESFYYGMAQTADLTFHRDDFSYWYQSSWGLPNDRTASASFDISAEFKTPVQKEVQPTVTTMHSSYTYTDNFVENLDPPAVIGDAVPAFSIVGVAGALAYSKKAIVQIYASILEPCELKQTSGLPVQLKGSLIKSGSVAVETFETDIEKEGYDPNGAPETPLLSQFVEEAMTGDNDKPAISAEFYEWHRIKKDDG